MGEDWEEREGEEGGRERDWAERERVGGRERGGESERERERGIEMESERRRQWFTSARETSEVCQLFPECDANCQEYGTFTERWTGFEIVSMQ